MNIRTRFAPSPTGELHIGGARTALFSYLFAKNRSGEFLLRIEDTDRERFVEGSVERIIESLNWLGIKADNKEPMIQSKRLEVYKKQAIKLVEEDKAYICTCSKEQLEKDRERQIKEGKAPKYVGRCREKSQIAPRLRSGQANHPSTPSITLGTSSLGASKSQTNSKFEISKGAVIRMKMPKKGKIVVDDLIHGKVEFDSALQDDQIILKSDGFPTYHLASVVDDNEMGISHVIRSDEWLSSTPKHLELYKMFGWKAPFFAHLPMILGPDKKKLSKRHGATSVLEYRDEGYLPEALINFIAFLGWNPKDERQDFTLPELEREFKLGNVNKSPAIFDLEKLNHINAYYLKSQISNLKSTGKISNLSEGESQLIGRGGFNTVKEVEEYIKKLRNEPEYDPALLIFKKSDKEKTLKGLEASSCQLSAISDWNLNTIQKKLEEVVTKEGLSNGDVFWPVRVALSGEEKSPSPVELIIALGKEKSLDRIQRAINRLKN